MEIVYLELNYPKILLLLIMDKLEIPTYRK